MHLGQLLQLICELGNKVRAPLTKEILIVGTIDSHLGQETPQKVTWDLKMANILQNIELIHLCQLLGFIYGHVFFFLAVKKCEL